jgi:hypothetical protein
VLRRHLVLRGHLADDLVDARALFETPPDEHRRLVQLEILLRVEVNEDAFAAVELREDDVVVRLEFGRIHQ